MPDNKGNRGQNDQSILKQLNKLEAQVGDLEGSLARVKNGIAELKKTQVVDFKEVEGITGKFDGKFMVTDSGEKYEVPSNYAAKTKLLYGDVLKMIKEDDRNFFKHVNKQRYQVVKGVLMKKDGVWVLLADSGSYNLSGDAVSFNKAEVNLEAEALVPEGNLNVPYAALSKVFRDKDETKVSNANNKGGETSKVADKPKPVEVKQEKVVKKESQVQPKSQPQRREKTLEVPQPPQPPKKTENVPSQPQGASSKPQRPKEQKEESDSKGHYMGDDDLR